MYLLVLGLLPLPPLAASQDVHIGMLSFRPIEETRQQWQELEQYLQQELPGYRIQIVPYGYDALETAIRQRDIDFVFTNPSHYVQVQQQYGISAPLATLIRAELGRQLMEFGGVIVVRADDPSIQQLADLRGKRIASPSPSSLGGYQVQYLELKSQLSGRVSLQTQFTGMPHDLAIHSLLRGEVDAAFVRTGLIEQLLDQGRLEASQIRVLNRQNLPRYPYASSTRLYPEWPFASMPHTDQELRHRVTSALLNLPHGSELGKRIGIHGFTVPLSYEEVHRLLRTLELPPFDSQQNFNLVEWLKRHSVTLFILLLCGALIMALLGVLLRNRRRLQAQQQLAEKWTRRYQLAEQRLHEYLEVSPAIMYSLELTEQGPRTTWISSNITRLLGYSNEEALKANWWQQHLHPDDREQAVDAMQRLYKQNRLRHEYRFYKRDGGVLHIVDQLQLYHDEARRSHVVGAWVDITEQVHARQNLEQEANTRRLLLASLGEGVYGVDMEGLCTFINPAALKMLGFEEHEVLGQHQHLLFHHHRPDGSHYPAAECPVHLTVKDGKSRHQDEWFIRKNGEGFPVDLTITPIEQGGERRGAVVVFRDTTEHKALLKRLKQMATTDFLTGLHNRRYFMEHLEQELARLQRHNHSEAALLLLDIDHFKKINDRFGHAAGDVALKELARQITQRLRKTDLMGRIGGEEFAVLLPDTDLPTACELAEILREQIEEGEMELEENKHCRMTISIGVTALRPNDPLAEDALQRADQAMYRAKQAGRNRVVCGDETAS